LILTFPLNFRVGGLGDKFGDGGKLVCPEYVRWNGVIFSLGSNGDFSFEAAMREAFPNTTIHTFDCTGDFEKQAPPSVYFHKWCLGDKDGVIGDKIFKTWQSILDELQIKKVDYLKMDIEGYEWNTLPYILESPQNLLPNQISFELHLRNYLFPKSGVPQYLSWKDGQSFFKPVMRFFHKIVTSGYSIVSNEINVYCPQCSEYVLVLTSNTSKPLLATSAAQNEKFSE
jgi:hypothetical protein